MLKSNCNHSTVTLPHAVAHFISFDFTFFLFLSFHATVNVTIRDFIHPKRKPANTYGKEQQHFYPLQLQHARNSGALSLVRHQKYEY